MCLKRIQGILASVSFVLDCHTEVVDIGRNVHTSITALLAKPEFAEWRQIVSQQLDQLSIEYVIEVVQNSTAIPAELSPLVELIGSHTSNGTGGIFSSTGLLLAPEGESWWEHWQEVLANVPTLYTQYSEEVSHHVQRTGPFSWAAGLWLWLPMLPAC